LAPETKLQAPQNEIWNTTNQWSFCRILDCQAPCINVKPAIEGFLATVLLVTLLGLSAHPQSFGAPIAIRRPGNCGPLSLRYAPDCVNALSSTHLLNVLNFFSWLNTTKKRY